MIVLKLLYYVKPIELQVMWDDVYYIYIMWFDLVNVFFSTTISLSKKMENDGHK